MSEDTTVLVGANNSGKTSAITALKYFLPQQNLFSVHDIPLSLWGRINELGELFSTSEIPDSEVHSQWATVLPSMDVWLTVEENEIHHVAHLIPTLDWKTAEGLGVRLQLAPKDSKDLLASFSRARRAASDLVPNRGAPAASDDGGGRSDGLAETTPRGTTQGKAFALWPEDLIDYLRKHMAGAMDIKAYLLDPAARGPAVDGVARPQTLSAESVPLDGHPLAELIRVDEIPADRGLSDYAGPGDEADDSRTSHSSRRQILTAQLRTYYARHLDPTKAPEPADIRALEAIHVAQSAFDERLRDSFKVPLDELQDLGYPGVANPRLVVSTHLKPVEGLNHQSAVQYDVSPGAESTSPSQRLPEQCNGLGYQNLIWMVFRLISSRDAWLKVGKASYQAAVGPGKETAPPPVHLVLLEEPEAHLHVQVQQVFIRKAFEVLRRHPVLAGESPLSTQLLVSTHSSHVAHEVDFARMRYFRRHPARKPGDIPTSTVLSLSEVFGKEDETTRFVARYLRVAHADLFFADGAILAEGAAERILVPYFIRSQFPGLHSSYITLLEVGGSHAHRLASLIEYLGINTLIITDLDAVESAGHHKKVPPERGAGLLTANSVLKKWHPKENTLDTLLDLDAVGKEKVYAEDFSVRVAYQTPVEVALTPTSEPATAIARTFEDALVLENIELFRTLHGTDLIKQLKEAVVGSKDVKALESALCAALDSGSKAGLALDLLCLEELKSLCVPTYIREGLGWLQEKLLRRQKELLIEPGKALPPIGTGR